MILNSEELTGLIHLSDSGISIPKIVKAKKTTYLPQLAQSSNGIFLGNNIHQGKSNPVFISQEWLTRHMAIFGGTGTGKTNLLGHLFQRLIRAHGGAFIDPNGDAAQEFLSLIPQNRINDVICFDPLKTPLSINPLDITDKQQIELATVNLLIALKRLFDASAWGPRMEWILRKTIKTLLLSGNKTLLDIPLMLTNDNYRKQVLVSINDVDLLNFWQNAFSKLSLHTLIPILDKLSVFTDSDIIKPIISQPKADIDFSDIINNQKIFIVNLSKGMLGEKNAHILGSFILSGLQMAILARANISQTQRKFYPLIIDEFHSYADSANVSSINSLLSEARKYKVALIIATQYLSQVDRRIKDAILGNVGTLISLKVGIDDAQVLQKELGQFNADDLLNLNVGESIVRMGAAKDSFNLQIPLLQKPDADYTQEILLAQQKEQAITNIPASFTTSTNLITPTPQPQSVQTNLTPEEKQFLEFLYQSTELMPFVKLAQRMSINTRKLYTLVNDLSQKGLAAEIKLKLSQKGKKSRVVVITQNGITALGQPPALGKGGAVHQYFQRTIKTYAEKKGYQVIIEQPLDRQKSVDLSLVKGKEKIAVEISITTNATKEFDNIQKCLSAGYDRLIILCADNQTLNALEKQVNQRLTAKQRGIINITPLNNIFQLI
jgi:DNA-binding MarR family transcriptional regulator